MGLRTGRFVGFTALIFCSVWARLNESSRAREGSIFISSSWLPFSAIADGSRRG